MKIERKFRKLLDFEYLSYGYFSKFYSSRNNIYKMKIIFMGLLYEINEKIFVKLRVDLK